MEHAQVRELLVQQLDRPHPGDFEEGIGEAETGEQLAGSSDPEAVDISEKEREVLGVGVGVGAEE